MANITADIEQLLAELVTITNKIAVLVNATASLANAPNDSDSLTSTANRLYLSATVIAVAAFLIATLQAILEYATSGESVRRKCNEAAIGPFSRLVKTSWSLRHWRRKVYYPVLEIDLEWSFVWSIRTSHILHKSVKKAMSQDDARPLDFKGEIGLERSKPSVSPLKGFLIRSLGPFRPPTKVQLRPRATWAQLFSASHLDVEDIFFKHKGDIAYSDADSISSALDVPSQIINISTLAKLAVIMGFKSISIDTDKRSFNAVGTMGSITTEELAGFGKVLRFQQHISNINKSPYRGIISTLSWKWATLALVRGVFDFPYSALMGSRAPPRFGDFRTKMKLQAQYMISCLNEPPSLDNHASSRIAVPSERNMGSLILTSFQDQAQSWTIQANDIYNGVKARSAQSILLAFTRWRERIEDEATFSAYPRILANLAVASLPLDISGFPARLFLTSFLGLCQRYCLDISRLLGRALTGYYSVGNGLRRNWCRINQFEPDHASFACVDFLGITNWTFELRQDEHQGLISGDISKYLEDMERDVDRMALLEPIPHLISNFDPLHWAQRVQKKVWGAEYTDMPDSIYDPGYMLRMQILFLDISTQRLLYKIYKGGEWNGLMFAGTSDLDELQLSHPDTFVSKVMVAIRETVFKGPSSGSRLFDCLEEELLRRIVEPGKISQERQEEVGKLADFLRMRVLLYAAYLMIIHDTSDILELEEEGRDFILPMI